MEHGHPLARLAAYVAAARARGRPTRLVLRNTERFGLIHLYFRQGRLVHVEGHQGTALNSLADLATWQYGVIRQDDVPTTLAQDTVDPRLELALSDVLTQLEARGIVQPAPPARVWPSPIQTSQASAPPISATHAPPATTTAGLPPLNATEPPLEPPVPPAAQPPQATSLDRLTEPQWQLLALVIHQVVEKAREQVGEQMAETLLLQALTHAARSRPILRGVELEPSGWLKVPADRPMTQHAAYDVADAVAAVLTGFELRCASLIGTERARQMIAGAAAPFRASLVQIGLAVEG